MHIAKLEISNLRVIEQLSIEPCEGVNLVIGDNGAGKTSVLEGIYLAGRGRTFRHKDAGPMIRKGSDYAQVVVELNNDCPSHSSILGVRREKASLICRLDGETVRRRSQLAEALPVQWIGSQPQQFLGLGPSVRRHFLDMGVFHVEHGYLSILSAFHQALRQRNAALRRGQRDTVDVWNGSFITAAEQITAVRRKLIDSLVPQTAALIAKWKAGFELTYRYKAGWSENTSLKDQLEKKTDVDRSMGFTSVGPQRAELELLAEGDSAEKRLSRGQQKILVLALNLALMDLIVERSQITPVLMIDDLAAELDTGNKRILIRELEERPGQVFLTKIETGSLPQFDAEHRMFHVEQGGLKYP